MYNGMCRTAVRPAMTYGHDIWGAIKAQEKRRDVVEMSMSIWMCDVTNLNRIRNGIIRRAVMFEETSNKLQERRLRSYGHVTKSDKEYVVKRMTRVDMDGPEQKERKPPKRRWMDSVNMDLMKKGMSGDETQNRAVWRQLVRYIDPT